MPMRFQEFTITGRLLSIDEPEAGLPRFEVHGTSSYLPDRIDAIPVYVPQGAMPKSAISVGDEVSAICRAQPGAEGLCGGFNWIAVSIAPKRPASSSPTENR